MKRTFLGTGVVLAAVVLFGIAPLSATQAILNNLKGKVEIKELNSGKWVPAKDGMVLNTLSTVSTGFDSSVTVVMDKTHVYVKPLTRMTIDKLVNEQGKISTSCYLRVGAVQASVKSAEGINQDFKVQSPYSTASVRGTDFDFDGLHLNVHEGLVAFIPGRPHRDAQPPAGTPTPDLSGDFAGAPATPADEAKVSFVPAGTTAETDGNGGKPGVSTDRNNLETGSSVPSSQTGLGGNLGKQGPVGPKLGSVHIVLKFPSQ